MLPIKFFFFTFSQECFRFMECVGCGRHEAAPVFIVIYNGMFFSDVIQSHHKYLCLVADWRQREREACSVFWECCV